MQTKTSESFTLLKKDLNTSGLLHRPKVNHTLKQSSVSRARIVFGCCMIVFSNENLH